jgi:hypothetical protein
MKTTTTDTGKLPVTTTEPTKPQIATWQCLLCKTVYNIYVTACRCQTKQKLYTYQGKVQ